MLSEQYSSQYLIFNSIKFLHDTKSAPLSNSCSTLYSILHDNNSWNHINFYLWKTYRKVVVGRVPVVQHLWFTPILPLIESAKGKLRRSDPEAHRVSSLEVSNIPTFPRHDAIKSARDNKSQLTAQQQSSSSSLPSQPFSGFFFSNQSNPKRSNSARKSSRLVTMRLMQRSK